ncbi:MAG TPA: phytanoyl-CoA dioxygenase family protein [Acidimicrobiales bacterium]|nr:phytanoyl-CoA dioxygenase family protein [Acidimicrobiales bacterium]
MRDEERYLFDLQGYLTVPDALSPDAVDELNAAVDELVEREMGREETTHRWGDVLPRSRVFRDLIDNPRVLPLLEELLGPKLRLDHEYIDVIRSGLGPIGARLHGGATPFDPVQYYRSGGGNLHSGLLVAAYNLKDVGPDDGGFACVPGSHKAAFRFPENWKDLSNPHPCVRRVTGPAGTAIIFTEAMTHGTLPWQGSDERRTMFYKYSPEPLAWSRRYYTPDDYPDLTDNQRNLLRPPGRSSAIY